MSVNPYVVLGVQSDATYQEIRAAYHRLARIHHPDHGGSAKRMAEVIAAYEAATGTHHDRNGGEVASRQRAPAPASGSSKTSAPEPSRTGSHDPVRSNPMRVTSPAVVWIALLVGAVVLVRIAVVILGPPLDTSVFLQLWAAASVAWLAHDEFQTLWG